MATSPKTERKPEIPSAPPADDGGGGQDVTAWDRPNLTGDWWNFFLLLLLYSIQSMPIGFATAVPLILQSKKSVSYDDQALLSVVLWPFSMKLLMAPIVDSLYSRRLGRRKSWLLPVQYLIGILLIYFAMNADDWLPESGTPNLKMVVIVLFTNTVLTAIQDIVVDGWALTILKKNNVSYASTCSSTGMTIGTFIGFICPVLLSSEDFCNSNLRATPSAGGIISIKTFLLSWGITFSLSTTLIGIFKKEEDVGSDEEYIKTNIFQTYKILWDIIKIKHMKLLLLAIVTSMVGFCTIDPMANLKLIDAGASKDNMIIVSAIMIVLKIPLPLIISKYTTGPKPMSLYLKMTPLRLLWSLVYAVLIYYTPYLLKNNEIFGMRVNYYVLLGLISFVNEILWVSMMTCFVAFFSRISDPLFGGTYFTLLNTARSLAWALPNSVMLKLVDTLTVIRTCPSDEDRKSYGLESLSYLESQSSDSDCGVIVEGYYVEVVLCLVIGFVWYGFFKNHLKRFQSIDRSHWLINSNRRTQDKPKPISASPE